MTSSELAFDPSLLPEPGLLNSMRDSNRPTPAPVRSSEWYTPSIMFGTPGVLLRTPVFPETEYRVGTIPIIYDCVPVGWYLSSIQPGFMTLGLHYANPPAGLTETDPEALALDIADDNDFFYVEGSHLPGLLGTRRRVYEEFPSISGWPSTFQRYSEIEVTIQFNNICDQVLLVLYMVKLRQR